MRKLKDSPRLKFEAGKSHRTVLGLNTVCLTIFES